MYRIAITMGDPAGIGSEIIVKALKEGKWGREDVIFYILGDIKAFNDISRKIGVEFNLPVISLERFESSKPDFSCLVDFKNIPNKIIYGVERALYGKCSIEYIEKGVYFCMSKIADALVTCPINKRSISLGGFHYPGHTEFIAEITNSPEVAMSFLSGKLWTALFTTHVPLSKAITLIKKDALVKKIKFVYGEIKKYEESVSVGVCALNPHGGEAGLFGVEEDLEIKPAVEECRNEGLAVFGPFSADTIYLRAIGGKFNVIFSLFHDQGMIPVKLLSFGNAVNITLGLPFLRTSVDHGTAFDIAGKGVAKSENLVEVINTTLELLDKKRIINGI